jgi:lipopolysaccharide/colanic/teichoic acid biosynthesis glycosyltransferase
MAANSIITTRSSKTPIKHGGVIEHFAPPMHAPLKAGPEWLPEAVQDRVLTPKKRRVVKPGHWQIAAGGNRSLLYLVSKRLLDICGSLALIILLSPLLLTALVINFIATKGHPLYPQIRLGRLGRPFRLYKFRTMVMNAEKLQDSVENQQDGPIFKNHSDPRITRIGKILRRTSVDELPQLFNVLFGRMSLVGPRPPLASEVAKYESWQLKRLSVKPGLTCLWQVSGRSEIGFHRWMLMDLWYVWHQNLFIDIALLLRTPWAILNRRGAY